MSPKVGLALGILGLGFFLVIKTFTGGDPRERYLRREEIKQKIQAEEKKQKYEPEDAFVLQIYTTFQGTKSKVVRKDLAKGLLKKMLKVHEPHGVNRSYNEFHETGELGIIRAHLDVEEQMYRGRGNQSFKGDSVPYKIEIELQVASRDGISDLEGTRQAVAKTLPPSSVAENVISSERKRQISDLMDQLFEKLNDMPSEEYPSMEDFQEETPAFDEMTERRESRSRRESRRSRRR